MNRSSRKKKIAESDVARSSADRRQKKVRIPRVGDVFSLKNDEATTGFMPKPSSSKSHKRVVTGTEEILSDFIVLDDEEIEKPVSKKSAKNDKDKEIEEDSFETREYNSMITQIDRQHVFVFPKTNTDNCGYRRRWEDALESVPESPCEYERPEFVVKSVVPVPLSEPASYLNKYAYKKLPLVETTSKTVKIDRQLLFSSHTQSSQFDAVAECSKTAGKIIKKILNRGVDHKGLFVMQIPNSLRVFDRKNMDKLVDEDIRLSEQNLNDDKIDLKAPIFVNNVVKERELPQALSLENFEHGVPFGKLQLLKSGKVVLRVGNRKFDVVMTSNNDDHNIAAIIDFTGIISKKRTPGPNKPVIHTCGKIEHFFSAFYDYEDILQDVQPLIPEKKETPVYSRPEEVDLTKSDAPKVEKTGVDDVDKQSTGVAVNTNTKKTAKKQSITPTKKRPTMNIESTTRILRSRK